MQVQFAQENGARPLQPEDNLGVLSRNAIFKNAACRSRTYSGRVDIVFQGDRNAVKRPAKLTALYFGFHLAGSRQRLLASDCDERVYGPIVSFDTVEARLHQIH